MAKQNRFHALQVVLLYVTAKCREILEHLAHNGLGFNVFVHPRVNVGKSIERVVNKITQRFRVFDFFKLFEALVVFHALRLEFVHAGIASLALLDAQNRIGILEDAFAQGNHVQCVFRRILVELRERVEQVQRKRLVHREVILQVHVHAQVAVTRSYSRHEFDNLLFDEAPEQQKCAMLQLLLACCTFMAILEKRTHGAATVRRAAQDVQKHPVIHLETRSERLRRRIYQALECVFIKRNVAMFRRFPLLEFFACGA